MRLLVCTLVFLSVSLTVSNPRPGMLAWVCRSCPNAMKQTFAGVEMNGPDGKVGDLKLTYMVPEVDVGPSLQIENANTRIAFENLQKQSTFAVRIHEGTCDNLGEEIHSTVCRRCKHSMGIKILEKQKKLTLTGDGSEGDIVGKMVVFYDKIGNSKLACGVVELLPEL